mgnify:FL=1
MERGDELSVDNILSEEEVENLFTEYDDTNEGTGPDDNKPDETEQNTTEVNVDTETLFTDEPESVSSDEDSEDTEGTKSNKDKSDSPKSNFYSSIAKALKEDGVFPDLDDESLKSIVNPEDFAAIVEKQIQQKLDDKQKRIDEALTVGVEPTEIKKYENSISYLKSITEDAIKNETAEGEQLRKQLIFQDFINRGYSKERATREVQKSLNTGTDIEDAKEALQSNLDYFTEEYEDLINEAKEAQKAAEAAKLAQLDNLKTTILSADKTFTDIQINQATRQKIFDNIAKPVYTDEKTGEKLTAIQKYERENRVEFLKNISMVFTLTDGFKNFDGLIKNKVRKELNKGIKELEHTINNTSRTTSGSLNFVSGASEDNESFIGKGWSLDV